MKKITVAYTLLITTLFAMATWAESPTDGLLPEIKNLIHKNLRLSQTSRPGDYHSEFENNTVVHVYGDKLVLGRMKWGIELSKRHYGQRDYRSTPITIPLNALRQTGTTETEISPGVSIRTRVEKSEKGINIRQETFQTNGSLSVTLESVRVNLTGDTAEIRMTKSGRDEEYIRSSAKFGVMAKSVHTQEPIIAEVAKLIGNNLETTNVNRTGSFHSELAGKPEIEIEKGHVIFGTQNWYNDTGAGYSFRREFGKEKISIPVDALTRFGVTETIYPDGEKVITTVKKAGSGVIIEQQRILKTMSLMRYAVSSLFKLDESFADKRKTYETLKIKIEGSNVDVQFAKQGNWDEWMRSATSYRAQIRAKVACNVAL
ncbi:MAG: hypothetical protein V4736_13400 [Bdellovibrionota bacterium]